MGLVDRRFSAYATSRAYPSNYLHPYYLTDVLGRGSYPSSDMHRPTRIPSEDPAAYERWQCIGAQREAMREWEARFMQELRANPPW